MHLLPSEASKKLPVQTDTGEGEFHLWPELWEVQASAPLVMAVAVPAMAITSGGPAVASAPPPESVRANMEMPLGEVFVVDNECVVCFERTVDSCLRPWCVATPCRGIYCGECADCSWVCAHSGHVAMCMDCAKKVGSTCPICRAGIESVEPYASAPPPAALDTAVETAANPLQDSGAAPLASAPLASAPPSVAPRPVAAAGGEGDGPEFIPSAKFAGVKEGYFYLKEQGDRGPGYYRRLRRADDV